MRTPSRTLSFIYHIALLFSVLACSREIDSRQTDKIDVYPYSPTWTSGITLGESVVPNIPSNTVDNLERQLDAKWSRPFEVTNRSGGNGSTLVTTCREALLGIASDVEPAHSYEYSAYQSSLAECLSVEHLTNAQPSRISHVRDFRLDESTVKKLPAALAFGMIERTEYERRQRDPIATIEDVQSITGLEVVTPYTTEFYDGEDGRQRLTILGYGDLNSDGVEDLLLKIEDDILSTNALLIRLFHLTRLHEGNSVTVIKEVQLK